MFSRRPPDFPCGKDKGPRVQAEVRVQLGHAELELPAGDMRLVEQTHGYLDTQIRRQKRAWAEETDLGLMVFTAVETITAQQWKHLEIIGNEKDTGPRTEAKGMAILLVQEKEKGPMIETKENHRDTGPRRVPCCSVLLSLLNLPQSPFAAAAAAPHPPSCRDSCSFKARSLTMLDLLSSPFCVSTSPFFSPPHCCHPVRRLKCHEGEPSPSLIVPRRPHFQ